jgi:hypothetical protein
MIKPNLNSKYQIAYIILLGIAWCVYTYYRGVITTSDSIFWESFADILIKHNFNYVEFLDNAKHRASPLFYSIWISIIALSKLLFGNNWGIGIVTINLLVGVSVAILLLKITWNTTGKLACTIFTSLFLVLCYDFHLWIPFALSDIIFTTICFSVFYLALTLCQGLAEPRRRFAGIIVLASIAVLFRPAWPPLLLFTTSSLFLAFFFRLKKLNNNERHNFILRSTSLICLLMPLTIGTHSYLMLNPDKWPFTIFGDYISYIASDYRKGIVLYGRLETFHFPPSTIWDYTNITLHKFFAFFYFDIKTYSSMHRLVNYIFFLPIYGLSVFAVAQLFNKANCLSPLIWITILECTSFILLFALFHSSSQIDYDFRYRIPCLLPLILLATIGFNELIDKFYKKNRTTI